MGEAQKRAKPGESQLFALAKQCHEDSLRWFPHTHNIPHHTLSMCGEAGEVANIVKKLDRGDLNIGDANTRYKLMMEVTDVFVYLLNISYLLGLDLEKAYMHVRAENEKRFGGKKNGS